MSQAPLSKLSKPIVAAVGLLIAFAGPARAQVSQDSGVTTNYRVLDNNPNFPTVTILTGIGGAYEYHGQSPLLVPVNVFVNPIQRVLVQASAGIGLATLTGPKKGTPIDVEVGASFFVYKGLWGSSVPLEHDASMAGGRSVSETTFVDVANLELVRSGPRAGVKYVQNGATLKYAMNEDVSLKRVMVYGGWNHAWRTNYTVDTGAYGTKSSARTVNGYIDALYGVSGLDPKSPSASTSKPATSSLGGRVGADVVWGRLFNLMAKGEAGLLPGPKNDYFLMLQLGIGLSL